MENLNYSILEENIKTLVSKVTQYNINKLNKIYI